MLPCTTENRLRVAAGEMMDVVCVCERFRCIHHSSVCFRRSFLIQLPQFFVFLFFFFFLLNCILNSTDAASNAARKQKNSWSLLKLVISFFFFFVFLSCWHFFGYLFITRRVGKNGGKKTFPSRCCRCCR